jgi:hypothetical protein
MMPRNTLRAAMVALSLSLLAPAAWASPLLGDAVVPAAVQRTLAADVRAARAANPVAFNRVRDLAGIRPAVYRATRLQRPSVVRELRAMGRDALFPMLDILAVSGASRALTADERDTLVLASIEALGALRDRRAEPVLRGAFERMTSPDAVRAAARALGTLNGDAEVALLTAAARAAGLRQAAALEGLGVTRRIEVAPTLTAALDSSEEATVLGAARGLAELGSTWGQVASGHAVTLPYATHLALANAFARHTSSHELLVAISAVATHDTLRAIEAVRADATGDTATRLDSLRRVVARGLAH